MYRIGVLSKIQFAKKRLKIQTPLLPDQLDKCNVLYLISNEDSSSFLVRTGAFFRHANFLLAQVVNAEILEKLDQNIFYEIFVRDDMVDFDEEEDPYFMEGFSLFTKNGEFIGKVEELQENPAHPILITSRDGEEVMIPLVAEFIVKVDKRKRKLFLDLPDGLI